MGKIMLVIAFFLMGSIYMLNIEKESTSGVLFNNPAESHGVAYYKTTEPREGAFSFLVPANWEISGGITRVEQEPKLYLKLSSPDNKTTVCWLPEMEFIVPENRSRNIGNTVDEQLKIKSLLTPADFVLTIAVPFAHPHAATIRVTDVKPITPVWMFSLSGEMNAANRQAAEVTISYWENGVFFKEKITCVIESYTENGDKKWRNFSTWYVRCDNNSFEAFEPIFSKIISSVEPDKAWTEREIQRRQIVSPR